MRYADFVLDSAPLTKEDVFLCAVPASVGFGLWFAHFVPTLLSAPTVLLPKFTVEGVFEAIQQHRATVLAAVSTQLIMMINHEVLSRYDLSSLKVLYTGGEPVPHKKAAQFERIVGAKVLQFYGSNEAGALSYTSVKDSAEKRLKTAGHIIEEMNIRLINENGEDVTASGYGQVVCKGPLTSDGYYNNEEANKDLYTEDGSIKLGDLVSIDEEGYLKVIGRVGDFIIRGGKNISAAMVEEAVLSHPAVKAAAVVAMPDPVFGEKVCAYLVVEGLINLDVPGLAAFLASNGVSKEYFPERIVIVDELPMVSGGKVARKILREDIRRKMEIESKKISDRL